MSTFPPPTSFVNILVFVKPDSAAPSGFSVSTTPTLPVITQNDTIINYQIFDSSGYDIVFTGANILPLGSDQLSTPTVSISGKQLTMSDANTKDVLLSVYLKFQIAGKPETAFQHDPQVSNTPPT